MARFLVAEGDIKGDSPCPVKLVTNQWGGRLYQVSSSIGIWNGLERPNQSFHADLMKASERYRPDMHA